MANVLSDVVATVIVVVVVVVTVIIVAIVIVVSRKVQAVSEQRASCGKLGSASGHTVLSDV